jgi:rhodanese-related sulfurtransferase
MTFLSYGQTTYTDLVDGLISKKVKTLSVKELKTRLAGQEQLIVLDAREKKEFEVSHIQGATYCGYSQFSKKAFKNMDRSKTVVVYCSVGYRSGKIGEKLIKMGFTDVINVYGGIFDWVNSGFPVYNASGSTNQVHGFDEEWGKWLKKGDKVFK